MGIMLIEDIELYGFLVGDTGKFLKNTWTNSSYSYGRDYTIDDEHGCYLNMDNNLKDAEKTERLAKIVDNGDGTYRCLTVHIGDDGEAIIQKKDKNKEIIPLKKVKFVPVIGGE